MIKNRIYILIISLFIFSACDKIEGPYIDLGGSEPTVDDFPELDYASVYRKILIEEYTGHRCTNCPTGHEKLSELSSLLRDTLVPICIHAGTLAEPRQAGLFTYDFRTTEGNTFYQDFNIGGIPAAVVNRTKFSSDKWKLDVNQWHGVLESTDRTVYAGIQMKTEKISEHVLKIGTKTTMLEEYSSPLHLSLFVVEDHIIKPQSNGSQNIEDYQHNHVFRGALNGAYGSPLSLDGVISKDSAYLLSYNLDFASKDWKIENTSIVAILHNPATKEVLQVEAIKP